jgi:hypothetical protein
MIAEQATEKVGGPTDCTADTAGGIPSSGHVSPEFVLYQLEELGNRLSLVERELSAVRSWGIVGLTLRLALSTSASVALFLMLFFPTWVESALPTRFSVVQQTVLSLLWVFAVYLTLSSYRAFIEIGVKRRLLEMELADGEALVRRAHRLPLRKEVSQGALEAATSRWLRIGPLDDAAPDR